MNAEDMQDHDDTSSDDGEEQLAGSPHTKWLSQPHQGSSVGNDVDTPNFGPDQKPAAPIQKRRRVTRACDECRRKKIKCDGKQPCTHCTVYSYGNGDAESSTALQANQS